ncbi:MAG: Wadjet anti-phage system protein JetD domain-containing protein [Wenzhouxiangella sp.]
MSAPAWTTPDELSDQVRRLWDSGRIQADQLDREDLFPLKLRLRRARSRDLDERFDAVRQWVRLLMAHARDQQGHGYEIQWRQINHRTRGANQLPWQIVVPTREDALKMIGKTRAAERFDSLSTELLAEFPALRDWLIRRPLEALKCGDDWPQLKGILRRFVQTPRPGVYLRQLDIPGVDTKFIQARRGLVSELLEAVLPKEAIDPTAGGVRGFNRRFGLASRPALVRFRILDPDLYLSGLSDLSVMPEEFARLDLAVDDVFVTENEINGLAFPPYPRAIVIFGLGYGLDRLAGIDWLARARTWYWGDIDTHGFAILNRFRHRLPQARSFLMDRATLDAHHDMWGQEPADCRFIGQLERLNDSETALYQALRDNALGERIRLEQEHVRFNWLEEFLGCHLKG